MNQKAFKKQYFTGLAWVTAICGKRLPKMIKDDEILVEFNNHCMNIVGKTSGIVPNCIGNPGNPNWDESAVLDLINKYKDHPSITKIKELGITKTSWISRSHYGRNQ